MDKTIVQLDCLECIKEPFICVINGVVDEYENGKLAQENLKGRVSFGIDEICIKDGKVCVLITDHQKDIDASNKRFIDEYREKYGVEPSMF